uniref:NADH-ubiquinone oxidoreductase chain 4 n=1 Tax=Tetrodontophora bielanensis TaxID=48717 RepID=Q9B509_TETBI|nr:NADH dehydrogenase subunit 4 [Tetrodontophora bielanensis]AAK30948.2 NADH dehydrogenase subunit 4 [Tetrodontophora bielanensis]
MMKFIFLLFTLGVALMLMEGGWWFIMLIMGMILIMFLFNSPLSEIYIYYFLEWGVDFLGFSLIMLSFWISLLMVSSSWMINKNNYYKEYFLFLIILLLIVLMLCFLSLNMMYFYFFFEVSLIPTLLIIMGWGYQLERLQAGVYFMLYTLTASLPLLLNLVHIFNKMGGLSMYMSLSGFSIMYLTNVIGFVVMLTLLMTFMAKLPIFFLHLWLPKAHVEAPVGGSMILAGVLLKLGGFGLCRFMALSGSILLKFSGYMIGLGIMSMVYVGFMCWRLNDMKALVAYSSVSHMGLVFSGLVTLFSWGFSGGLIMMVSHGLSSSGLFCAVNMYYERVGSRSMYMNKGFMLMFPLFSLMFFMLCVANISAPPTINLMGEIFLMLSVMAFSKIMIILFPLGSFLGAVFTLFLYSYSQHGKSYFMGKSYLGVTMNELHSLILHLVPLNILIVKSEVFFI